MNAWTKKHNVLFNFIDKKIKLDSEKFNLISYKIANNSTDCIAIRVIYCNTSISREVIFSKIIIYLNEYDIFVRKTKIENLSKI